MGLWIALLWKINLYKGNYRHENQHFWIGICWNRIGCLLGTKGHQVIGVDVNPLKVKTRLPYNKHS